MDNPGLYNIVKDNKNVLYHNGIEVSSSFNDSIDSLGIRVEGTHLKMDGVPLASAKAGSHLVERLRKTMFGDAVIFADGECINITIDDYNKLLNGENVPGYSAYNRKLLYNIVSNPSTSSIIKFKKDGEYIRFNTGVSTLNCDDIIYNNVSGILQENVLDLTQTMLKPDPPFVNLRQFNPVIAAGSGLVVKYYVDAKSMPLADSNEIGGTFTLHIEVLDETNTVLSEIKKTTFAGYNNIELPAFVNPGEFWLKIWCVDSRGVGSVEQHIDVLVKNLTTPNIYKMREDDLEAFGIQPDNDDVLVAYNNKAALSSFFADTKERGYDGVKMLNRTYWIDIHSTFGTQTYYKCKIENKIITDVVEISEQEAVDYGQVHLFTPTSSNPKPSVGSSCNTTDALYYYVINTSTAGDNIIFPDSFTVDLNGATIASVQFTDLRGGNIIYLNGFDSHIINGKIIGSYDGFDFDLSKIRVGGGTAAEHVSNLRFGYSSRFCSAENLDISKSLGYDIGTGGEYTTFYGVGISSSNSMKRIDLSTGEVVPLDSEDEPMVISELVELKNSSYKTITIGRTGQGSYNGGTQREMFFAFYDSNKVYLGYAKTKMYYINKIPLATKFVRLIGYGSPNDWEYNSAAGIFGFNTNPTYTTNAVVDNCYIHDTRTCAITLSGGYGILLSNCTWHNIALESGKHQVTKILGDFEDGWQRLQRVTITGCSVDTGNGSNYFAVHYCNKFEFTNNEGIDLDNRGGIEDGFIENNKLPGYSLSRNFRSLRPFVIYRDNVLSKLSISYENSQGNTHNTDMVNPIVAMRDSEIGNLVDYENLCLSGMSIINGIVES